MTLYRPTYRDARTGERKQSKVWWYEFTIAGRRIRESSGTTRRTLALEAAKRRRLELERALAGLPVHEPEQRVRTVKEVLNDFVQAYAVNHRPKSVALVEYRAKPLERLLGSLFIPDLTEARLVDYTRTRQQEGASNRTINLELGVLAQAIGQPWRTLWPRLRRLEENRDVGRALDHDEEQRLLEAASRSRSPLLYPYVMLLLWTGMRADEARTLQWKHVDFERGEVQVGKSKTAAGTRRVIPMSQPLRAVLEHYASRYAAWFGSIQPEWYVFPGCRRYKPVDPTRPVGSLRHAWELARQRAGVRCRLHDLRHSFCTKLAEAGVPEPVMFDIMGHVSQAMLRRYSHIRVQARQEAIAVLERRENSVQLPKDSPQAAGFRGRESPVTH